MKHLLLSTLLLAGLISGCKKKEEPAPTPSIVGAWKLEGQTIRATNGQIDPQQPPPTVPLGMVCTYGADGTLDVFATGTHSIGTYALRGDQLTQTVGYSPGTYTVQELTNKRLQTLLSYQNGTAHYNITDYYTKP